MFKLKLGMVCVGILVLSSCQSQDSMESRNKALWLDVTDQLLPRTSEWTNRVELADLNGDGRVDLLFANGGKYSEPGKPELNRVFANRGPDAPFEEITKQVLGSQADLARVIKVRDVSGDGVPDILVTHQE